MSNTKTMFKNNNPLFNILGFKSLSPRITRAILDAMCVFTNDSGCKYKASQFSFFLKGSHLDFRMERVLLVRNQSGSRMASRFAKSRVYPSMGVVYLNYSWRWKLSRFRNAMYMLCIIYRLSTETVVDGESLTRCK